MKRYLDDFLYEQMENNNSYVISSDVGYFPKSRSHKNFIDIGNNEFCAGTVAEGLLSNGNNVFIYDICGYILKNSYASLFARNNEYHKDKGILTILGWGSGFSYDGCLLGHYPFDDLLLAKLLGLNLRIPYNEKTFLESINNITNNSYIRMFDLSVYNKDVLYFTAKDYRYTFIAEGWLYPLLIDMYGNRKDICIVPFEEKNIHRYFNSNKIIHFTDQIEPIFNYSDFVKIVHPKNPNVEDVQELYKNKDSFIKNLIISNVSKLLD